MRVSKTVLASGTPALLRVFSGVVSDEGIAEPSLRDHGRVFDKGADDAAMLQGEGVKALDVEALEDVVGLLADHVSGDLCVRGTRTALSCSQRRLSRGGTALI